MVLSNITMINVGTPFYVAYSSDAPYSVNNLGVGRIIVNNLVALDAGKIPIYISAPPNNPAKSIILNNVRVTVAGGANETQSEGQGFSPFSILQSYGVYAHNVQNLELNDVKFDSTLPDLRPAFFGEHVGTVELDIFSSGHRRRWRASDSARRNRSSPDRRNGAFFSECADHIRDIPHSSAIARSLRGNGRRGEQRDCRLSERLHASWSRNCHTKCCASRE